MEKKTQNNIEAIIFDLDGTLADSFHFFSKRFKSTFRKV